MARLEQAVIVNRDTQTADTAVYRRDLPKSGAYSALDIGIRMTNGATSCINKDMLTNIKKLYLVFNGNDYRIAISGQEMFRHQWLKMGKPMPYNFDESASAVQECWFRILLGRFLGDPMYGLNLDKYDNVQVQIDYDMTAVGAIAATTFATGTFAPTIIAHQFPYNARPSFRGMIGTRQMWTGTSVASGDVVQNLPSSNPILALNVAAMETNVAQSTDITDISVGFDNFSRMILNGKWYNFAAQQNAALAVREELYKLLLSQGATRATHLENIKQANCVVRAYTAGS